jgi:TonB family protein
VFFYLEGNAMNTALFYRPSRRWLVWAAFACAAGIHIAAIVVAQGKSDKVALQDFKLAGADIEIVDKGQEETPPEDVAMPPPPAQLPTGLETFPEEIRTPPPVRSRKKVRVASFVRGTAAPLGGVIALVTYAPRPVYPYEARRQRITGSGIALLTVAPVDGNVIDVRMAQSCGSPVLDNATLDAFRRWRFKPGTVEWVQVPITYTLTGASY